jgi:hypothetical protein
MIRVLTNNFHLVGGGVLADDIQLVLRRILLMLGGHAHIVRSSLENRRVRDGSGLLLHLFATGSCEIENPP